MDFDIETVQGMVNNGTAWRMEGSFGRSVMAALEAGKLILGTESTSDYWGNRIPSRYEVQPGTKGSFDLAAEMHGMEYAQRLADVE